MFGVGPIVACYPIGYSGDVRRFPSAGHYARYMPEVERLVDDSAANVIIIVDDATIEDISQTASWRGRRIVLRFSDADVDVSWSASCNRS